MQEQVLVMLFDAGNDLLLGLKKEKLFGGGKWNGFGGKIEPHELPLVAAFRELGEEAGVAQEDLQGSELRHVATLRFSNVPDQSEEIRVTVFRGDILPRKSSPAYRTLEDDDGEYDDIECWSIGMIPFDKMWPDDVFWLPYVARKGPKKLNGTFIFDDDGGISTVSIWLT